VGGEEKSESHRQECVRKKGASQVTSPAETNATSEGRVKQKKKQQKTQQTTEKKKKKDNLLASKRLTVLLEERLGRRGVGWVGG